MRIHGQTSLAFLLTALLLPLGLGFGQTSKSKVGSPTPLSQAKSQLAKHDLQSAEDSVWKILSSNPNNPEALVLLGVIRDNQQRYPEAEAVLLRAAQLDPQSAQAHLYLGKTYLAENKLPEATEQYKAARKLAPNDVETRVTLAKLYAANAEFGLAMTTLEGIPPGRLPAEAIPIEVGSLLASGSKDEAVRKAEAVKNPPINLALAEVFVAFRLPEPALKMLSVADTLGRRPPARYYFIKAKALDASGNPVLALENVRKAITLEPGSEEFLLAAAELYARQEKHADAYEMLQRAYKIDHDSPGVLRPLILEASFAGKSAEVQDAAEQLVAKSDDPKDLFVAASVFLKNLRQNEAVPLLEKYLDKFPDDARAWVGLGVGYEDEKRFPDAQKAFEHALAADPKFAEAEYQLGVLTSLAGDSVAAMQHYERALQLNPDHVLAMTKLGDLFLQGAQFEKARDVLLKAESLDPQNGQTEYGLALAYGKLGDRQQATTHMARFQQLKQVPPQKDAKAN